MTTSHVLRSLLVRDSIIGALIGIALGIFYGLFAPKWFEAQIAVVPGGQQKGASSLASLAGSLPVDLPFDIGGSGSGTADVERIQAVMKSRSVTDAVIQKFNLSDRYQESHIEITRKALWQHCSTKLDKKPAVVTITCEDRDPRVAQQMAEYFGEIGNDVLRRISASSASEERRFLERRVADAKHDVQAASEKVRDFELSHKLVDIGEQSKAVVSAMATLKGELLSKQLQLSYLSSFSAEDESTAKQLRKQMTIMENKLKSLEEAPAEPTSSVAPTAKKLAGEDTGLFPPAMSVPTLRAELTELFREQKIQETVFLMLTQRYETAKVNEARDTSAFQILDHASLPTRRSRPRLSLSALAGLLLGVGVGFGRRRLFDWLRVARTA